MEQQKNLLSAFQNSLWKKLLLEKLNKCNCYQLPLIISHCDYYLEHSNISLNERKTLAILNAMFERTKALEADNLWLSSD